nr:hypothetical protein [Tanacetum cinerariifolium]
GALRSLEALPRATKILVLSPEWIVILIELDLPPLAHIQFFLVEDVLETLV